MQYTPPERPTPRLTRVLAAVPARVHSPTTHDERMRQQENQQQQSEEPVVDTEPQDGASC